MSSLEKKNVTNYTIKVFFNNDNYEKSNFENNGN